MKQLFYTLLLFSFLYACEEEKLVIDIKKANIPPITPKFTRAKKMKRIDLDIFASKRHKTEEESIVEEPSDSIHYTKPKVREDDNAQA